MMMWLAWWNISSVYMIELEANIKANHSNLIHWLLPALMVVAVVTAVFWNTWAGLCRQWTHNADYSHGILIPLISLILIWEKREKLFKLEPAADWRGLLIMAIGIGLFAVGELGAELFTTRAAVITLLIGAVWWLYSRAVIRVIALPLALLYFMLPLPGFLQRNLTFPLQIISSSVSVDLLNSLGFAAYREGNVIDMGFSQFQVVEACSGLRFILTLLCLGTLCAFYKPMPWWKRAVLVGVTVPLAVATNIVRIAGTGILAHYFGLEVAQGFFHDFSGLAVFMVCFVVFIGIAALLNRLPGSCSPRVYEEDKREASAAGNQQSRLIATGTALVIFFVSPMVVGALGNVPPMALKKALTEFPLRLGGRIGQRGLMDKTVWQKIGGQEYAIINYRQAGRPTYNFYTAYYEYQKKAGDFIHSPRLCLPGAGWHIDSSRVRILKTGSRSTYGGRLKINELVIDKDGSRQLVYFWYQGRDRNFTSEWAAKFYLVWDGIFRRRTDGALVRLIAPATSKEMLDNLRRDLDGFAVLASHTLDEYLP